MRPSSSSLEGNIAFSLRCTDLSQGFPHRHMPRSFSVQNWVSPSTEPAHDTSSSTRKHNSQVISGVESVQGSYWLSHMHPGKYKACAPGNWCYLKENRFTLMGFAVWQAQKTRTGADCLEFTAWKTCFFLFFRTDCESVRPPPVTTFSKHSEGNRGLKWPMSAPKEAGRKIQLLRQWTKQEIWVKFLTLTQVSFMTFSKSCCCLGLLCRVWKMLLPPLTPRVCFAC